MAQHLGLVDEEKIYSLLEKAKPADTPHALEIVERARECRGLDLDDLAILLQTEDEDVISAAYEAALYMRNTIYGRRMVFFAPLYVSNVCANNCLYCGFRRDNTGLVRRVLTMDEVRREVNILLAEGHKRILPRNAHIPATTAVGSIDPFGREKALMARANVVMPNCTPLEYRVNYEI